MDPTATKGVLIVDDHPDQCRALSLLLQRRGYHVHYVENGVDAINFVSSHPLRLILLDVMMPEMSGMEVLRKLREDQSLNAISVCMYSAVDDPRWREEAERLGAEGYLIKGSLDLRELFEWIDRHSSSHSPSTPDG